MQPGELTRKKRRRTTRAIVNSELVAHMRLNDMVVQLMDEPAHAKTKQEICGLEPRRGPQPLAPDSAPDSVSGDEFIIIDENSVFGRRRHSIEERNERAHDQAITLYPFAHQVGGHTQLLALDRATLCKPLVPRELLFYLNVPSQLASFVPAYKGVVQVAQSNNYQPPVVHQPVRSRKSPFAVARLHEAASNGKAPGQLARNKSTECAPLELHVQLRPFTDEKILEKNLSQDNLLGADYISRPNEKYLLLLENVASKYQLPCILDLKMGTRQHDDDASEEKRHRQIAKCQASTSASLGLRLCGMQVYKVDYGGYLWYDKYSGRKMDERGLKRALRQYFRTGPRQLGAQIIEQIIERLNKLHEAVLKSPAFRFYGTSLLIIHESCQVISERPPVDVRLIDFAHTICDFQASGRALSSPSILKSESVCGATLAQLDERAAAAVNSKEDRQKVALELDQNKPSVDSTSRVACQNSHLNDTITTTSTINRQDQTSGHNKQQASKQASQTPTVTLTQTATTITNTTTRKTSRHSIGPDKGLLFGLENLVSLLESIKAENEPTKVDCSDGASEN